MTKKSSANLTRIAAMLSDGQYHDGNSLGESLQMTRSAIWKMIKKLQQYGINIASVKGKGYVLSEPLQLLDTAIITKNLSSIVDVEIFESIDSTNRYLKQFKQINHPKICLAEQQTQGRGRFNRYWHSPFGQNLYFSCLYPFRKDISELSGLSLLTSLAVIKTLQELGVKKNLGVKWSNDIIFDGKKLAGNLIELQAEVNAGCLAIIGIGLNVNMVSDEEHVISQEWTSLRMILDKMVDRNTLVVSLIKNLMEYLHAFVQHGFQYFIDEWNTVDCLRNKTISLVHFNETVQGRVVGINQLGHLILELPNGEVKSFASGETSLS